MKISINRKTASITMIAGMALSLAFAGSALADATSTSSTTNLVINGGFETPVVANSDKWDIFPSGTAGLGWTVEWESRDATTYEGYTQPSTPLLEIQQSGHLGYRPVEGNQWGELDTDWTGPNDKNYMSFPASVNIYQDIATVPGNTYALSFSFGARPDAPNADENVLNLSWNGNQVDSLSLQNNSHTDIEWKSYSYPTLTATASTTRLEFSDGGIPDGVGTYLDNVVLTNMEGGGNGGGGGDTGTSTGTSTNPGGGNGGGGGTGTTTATSTDTGGNGGGGSGSTGGGGGSPVVTASGYGGNGGGAPSSGGGQVLGASTGPGIGNGGGSSAPVGSVLGDSTSTLPNMPYTGTNGNATLTYLAGYLGLLLASEAMVSYFSKEKVQK